MKRRVLIPFILALLLVAALSPAAFAGPLADTIIEENEVVNNDVVVLDGDLEIRSGAEVNGDIAVFNGDAFIDGAVNGSVTLFNGDLETGRGASISGECVLLNGDVLGVAWGRTVLSLAENLPEKAMPDSCVVQVIGSQRSAYDGFTAEECVAFIARRLHARSINLHAPAALSNAALRDALMREPTIQEQFARIRSCNKLLFGVCTVKANSLVFASGLISVDESKYYIANGAVGVIAGRFYDIDGNWLRGTMDDRMIGINLEDVRSVPTRIAAAGGPDKTDAILGALRGDYVTALITDEPTARNILGRL